MSPLPPFPDDVPVVSLASISLAKLAESDPLEGRKLYDACCNLGFLYVDLTGHADGRELLKEAEGVFDVAAQLSAISRQEREQYRSKDNVWGYKAQPLGVATANRTFAFNTSIDDLLTGRPLRSVPPLMSQEPNRGHLTRSARLAQRINMLILTHLERALALREGSFTSLHSNGEKATSSHLSITVTPPPDQGDHRKAFNAHTDHGTCTLVLHNVLGGLQVLVPNNYSTGGNEPGAHWAYVKPLPGHAIVNLGDIMSLLTNSLYRSNVHRVLDPPGAQAGHTRYSLVYFLYPVDDYSVPVESVLKLGKTEHSDAERAAAGGETMAFKEFISRRLGWGAEGEERRKQDAFHVEGYEPGIFGERERALLAMAGID